MSRRMYTDKQVESKALNAINADVTDEGLEFNDPVIFNENVKTEGTVSTKEVVLTDEDSFGIDDNGIYIKWTGVKYYVRYDTEQERLMFVEDSAR